MHWHATAHSKKLTILVNNMYQTSLATWLVTVKATLTTLKQLNIEKRQAS